MSGGRLIPDGPPGRIYLPKDLEEKDETAMTTAVALARNSHAESGIPPFGCLLADEGGMVRAATWGTGTRTDPTAHSELRAIQLACRRIGGLLYGCTIYSTHEPCPMCCGAITHAKISRVVWGSAREDRPDLFAPREIPPGARLVDTAIPPQIVSGYMRDECVALFDGLHRWDSG